MQSFVLSAALRIIDEPQAKSRLKRLLSANLNVSQ